MRLNLFMNIISKKIIFIIRNNYFMFFRKKKKLEENNINALAIFGIVVDIFAYLGIIIAVLDSMDISDLNYDYFKWSELIREIR